MDKAAANSEGDGVKRQNAHHEEKADLDFHKHFEAVEVERTVLREDNVLAEA